MSSQLTTTNSPPEDLRRALIQRADEIAMLTTVASEALEIAKDPECTIQNFSCVIQRDVKLATELLSLTNSAVFAGGHPITSLKEAIVRLGFRQCRNLILTSSAASLMKSVPLEQEWIREILWQHSFTTATACVHLNRSLNLGFQGEEFTAGLLHDFGRLLLAVAAPERFAEADAMHFDESGELLTLESAVLGVNHCEFGAWFANYSGLPDSLAAVLRWHHEPSVVQPHQKLVALTSAADHMANHLQRVEEAMGYRPAENPGIAQLSSLAGSNLVEQFSGIAETLLEVILCDTRLAATGCSNITMSEAH